MKWCSSKIMTKADDCIEHIISVPKIRGNANNAVYIT